MEASLNNIRTHHVDAKDTNFYKPVLSNLHNPEFSKALLNPNSIAQIGQAVTQQTRFDAEYRTKLVKVLKKQYQNSLVNLKKDSKVLQNIEKLSDTNTLTVTTGQQIHIFLGPFFVVNKILSCCAEAKQCEASLPNNDVVPVFWMASEDHDFDEIKSTRLYNETYEWDIDSSGPVGRLDPKSIVPLVEKALQRIDQTEENVHFLESCKFAYSNCKTFADATRYIIHKHFEATGIVVIDMDDPFLKSKSADLFGADIFDHAHSKAIDQGITKMKGYGIKAPINTRPINTFYITDTQRNRIEKKSAGVFKLIGTDTSLTSDKIRQELQENPERFSPNALLRPLYQQAILPNIQYVCGASEIVYWMELKDAMDTANLIYPKLTVRKSMFFLSDKNIQKLDKNQIPVSYLFLDKKSVTEILASRDNELITDLASCIARIDFQLNQVKNTFNRFEFLNTKKTEKLNNQVISQLNQQYAILVEKISSGNADLSLVIKIKSNLYDETYNQERNKFILGMLPQMDMAQVLFKKDSHYFSNHEIITMISH